MAQKQLFDPQTNDGQGRRQRHGQEAKEVRNKAERAEEGARWLLHEQRQNGKAKRTAQLILPPGVQRDAGIEAWLQRYHTDPEFHAKIEGAINAAFEQERQRILFGPDDKEYLIRTEDGMPASNATHMLEEMMQVRRWEEIEALALTEREREEEAERALICIWCGMVCADADALAEHEDGCA